jgi:hypothetical protein
MRDECASGFDAQSRRDPGHDYALAGKIDFLKHLIGCRFESKGLCHFCYLESSILFWQKYAGFLMLNSFAAI